MCGVGDVVRAVDFALWNGDVSGWTVGHRKWRDTVFLGLRVPAAQALNSSLKF